MTKHRKNKAGSEEAAKTAGTSPALALEKEKPANPSAQPRLKPKKDEVEIQEPSAPVRLLNFFRDAKKELTRVTWPTRKETVKSTGVLLVLVAISSAYLGLVDSFLSWILRLLVG
jgi:preprotein translocase subunit SecE